MPVRLAAKESSLTLVDGAQGRPSVQTDRLLVFGAAAHYDPKV
jgi:hypothetical protein